MALGLLQREDFVADAFPKFKENYDTVHIDQQFIEMIRTLHSGIRCVVVLGTWCGDSKREVPRFLKIIDLCGIPPSDITFFGVDRSKISADGFTNRHKIERVPTFIFLKNGEEIGRIVESPKTTLEADMLSILADAYNQVH